MYKSIEATSDIDPDGATAIRLSPSWEAAEAVIARRFGAVPDSGLAIYRHLQNVIIGLVQERALAVSAQLPPDQRLAAVLKVSLGTVQRALGNLAAQGWVSRQHGRGTFVAKPRQPMTASWHFRFCDSVSGAPLPVFSKLLARQEVVGPSIVQAELGHDPKGYVAIERLFDVAGHFSCYGVLYLRADRFARLLEIPGDDLEDVNLKEVFAKTFEAPTLSVRERVRAAALPPDIAAHLDESPNAASLCLEILARTHGSAPLSFQQIYIPATAIPLELGSLRAGPEHD